MALSERVSIARRFQRSVRIDSDLSDPKALDGFVCPKSSADILNVMAQHVEETQHTAFTWTGPYGSGKSSLVIALSAALMGTAKKRQAAESILSKEVCANLWRALPPRSKGWKVLPVVARRGEPVEVIVEALEQAGYASGKSAKKWTSKSVVSLIEDVATAEAKTSGGLVVFIDEMGKFLEAAADDDADVYLFQELAEAASRSKGRLVVVGILHQSFEEYANRLSREVRDEWTKIQGRFVDLAVNVAGEEQIDLLARAIEHDQGRLLPGSVSSDVADIIKGARPAASDRLAETLEDCWPLNAVTAALLGPISRRRFGQNQRSVFGFLNSAEQFGFQEFLDTSSDGQLYSPAMLWDYLQQNLEHSILASPDGHRWSMAVDAIERCEAGNPEALDIDVLKTIAIVDLFKERSGLVVSKKLIGAALPKVPATKIASTIKRLQQKSLVVYRKFASSYAIFAGSDFDLERALEQAAQNVDTPDFKLLRRLANLQPILAKRHYHETGSMRWFDVTLAPLSEVTNAAGSFHGSSGAIGQFILAIPTEKEAESQSHQKCRELARLESDWDVVVGFSSHGWAIVEIARDLRALELVRDDSIELAGDPVGRREVSARITELQGLLETELSNAFATATWFLKHHRPLPLHQAKLSALASDLADKRYPECPRIHSELLNRAKPSGSAIAAQNALLKRMVMHETDERLGIEGFPAEGGLYATLLDATGLHRPDLATTGFVAPQPHDDPFVLSPLWEAAASYLRRNEDRLVYVSELYELWAQPPFGIKQGLMPVLAVAFALSRRNSLAFYRQDVFQSRLKDLDVEYLARDPADIQLRWMDMTDISQEMLKGMRTIVSDMSEGETPKDLEPINVARALIATFDALPPWSKRTSRVSKNAINIRQLFKQANDPNKFLFDDLPSLYGAELDISVPKDLKKVVKNVRDGLTELQDAYPTLIKNLRKTMLSELKHEGTGTRSNEALQARAENVRQIAGDFRLDAFIGRLTTYDDTDAAVESLASLATNKPPGDWVDPDIDRALLELSEMSRRFVRLETFAHIKGRENKRHALAVVVGLNGAASPLLGEFEIAQTERGDVDAVVDRLTAALGSVGVHDRNIILAALAELSAQYLGQPVTKPKTPKKKASRTVTRRKKAAA